jgi:hypothetical protein
MKNLNYLFYLEFIQFFSINTWSTHFWLDCTILTNGITFKANRTEFIVANRTFVYARNLFSYEKWKKKYF